MSAADEKPLRRHVENSWTLDWGRLLRTARQVAGMSLTALSTATGISKGHLSKLESGHETAQNPSRATLAALARALPSFGPLAHALEPTETPNGLAFALVAPEPPAFVPDEQGQISTSPVKLGWQELEVVLALLTLEQAAIAQPMTARLLARALQRPVASIMPVLEQLITMGVLVAHAPRFSGDAVTYQRANNFTERVGIAKVGDALILAAALLVQSPQLPQLPHRVPNRYNLEPNDNDREVDEGYDRSAPFRSR